jgi:glycosyltransferase involved in cell wall biosynthesis
MLQSQLTIGGSSMAKSVAIIGTRGYPSYYGGFETAVRKIAPYLADHGWDVTVYGRKGTTRDDDPLRDVRVKRVTTAGVQTKSISTLSYGLTASLHAFRGKPSAALVMNVANGFFLPALRLRGVPTLVNVDGIEWDRAKWGRIARSVFHLGAHWSAKFGTRMVYDSREIERRWMAEFGVEGDFIPYGGDIPGPLPVVDGLKHRGYILLVARFVPENTVPEFLDAAAELATRYPVVIVGSSGFGGELDERARQLDTDLTNVTWMGHVSDDSKLLSLWQHAGVYFHGHSVGGTNPALVQAMAAGAPIVARDTPYNREVLGNVGRYSDPNKDAIKSALIDVLAHPEIAEQMSRDAESRAAEHYGWDMVCENYRLALERLLSRQHRSMS